VSTPNTDNLTPAKRDPRDIVTLIRAAAANIEWLDIGEEIANDYLAPDDHEKRVQEVTGLLESATITATWAEPGVYRERAHLVAFLATLFPSVCAYSDPAEPDWLVVYVSSPMGQLSWHISPADRDLFGHVPRVPWDHPAAQWDGHTTAEKYGRLARMIPLTQRGAKALAADPLPSDDPLIDPDCRDGKCGSCVGGPCEHDCHSEATS